MILVTGCNGLAGRAFLKELAAQNVKTRALLRDGVSPGAGVEVVKGDLQMMNTLESALKGVTVLIAAAGGPKQHAAQPALYDAARRAKVKHIIKWSITGAMKNSPVGLGQRHALGEEHVAKSGVPHTIVRAHFPMQFFLYAAEALRAGTLTSATNDAKFAMLDIRDMAKLIAQWLPNIAAHDKKTHWVTGKELSNYSDMLAAIGTAVKRKLTHTNVSAAALKGELDKQGFAPWIVQDIPTTHEALTMRADMYHDTLEKNGVAARTVRDFARDYADAFA